QFSWHRDYLSRVFEVDDDLLDLWNVGYVVDPAAFGSMPHYQGVEFLPGHALVHAPAGSATSERSFALAPGSSVSGLRIVSALMNTVELPQNTPVADLELRGPNNEVVGRAQLVAGRDTMEWAYDLPRVRPFVQHQRAEVAGRAFEGSSSTSERLLSY